MRRKPFFKGGALHYFKGKYDCFRRSCHYFRRNNVFRRFFKGRMKDGFSPRRKLILRFLRTRRRNPPCKPVCKTVKNQGSFVRLVSFFRSAGFFRKCAFFQAALKVAYRFSLYFCACICVISVFQEQPLCLRSKPVASCRKHNACKARMHSKRERGGSFSRDFSATVKASCLF